MKILQIWDFDGVLVDSADEVALNAWNAQNGCLAASLAELPPDYLKLFRQSLAWTHCPSGLMILADWCCQCLADSSRPQTRVDFDGYRKGQSWPKAELRETFFAKRNELVQQSKSKWLELTRPFEPIWSTVVHSSLAAQVWVLTNKNRAAVQDICEHLGWRINPRQIIAGDAGQSKAESLQRLLTQYPDRLGFLVIEDSLANLTALRAATAQEPGGRYLLAEWGYCSPADCRAARQAGFEVLSQQSLARSMDPARSLLLR